LANCGRNTVYKIKRARRDGVQFAIEKDLDRFVSTFNLFLQESNPVPLARSDLDSYGDHLTLTKAVLQGEPLVMHCYLVHGHSSRARLLHSASTYHGVQDSAKRGLIGRANRFLHFEDMLHFKRSGLRLYDLGGYALDTSDPKRLAINEFKDGFGGELK